MTMTSDGDQDTEPVLPTSGGSRLTGRLSRQFAQRPALAVGSAFLVAAVAVTAAVGLVGAAGDRPADAAAKPAAASKDSFLQPVGDLLKGDSDLPLPALTGDQGDTGVPKGTAPRPTTPPKDPPADAGQVATYGGGPGTLTPVGIATLAMAAGCSPDSAAIATAVAMAESGGSPSAQGDTTLMDGTWDWSAGLWQIRGLKSERGTGQLRDSIANHQPAKNAAAMYTISSGCSDWGPWTTYTRGTYQSFLAIAQRAVDYVVAYRRAHGGALPPVAAPDPNATVPVGGTGGTGTGPQGGGTGAAAAGKSSRPASRSTSRAKPTKAASSSGRSSSRPRGGTGGGGAASTRPANPLPTSSAKLPIPLPSKLPIQLPTKLPTTLPTKLPTKLPTLIKTSGLPLPLPSLPLLG